MGDDLGITIRAATEADAAALTRLFSAFTGLDTSAASLRERLRQSAGVEHPLVAERDGEVVAVASLRLHACLGEDAPYAELSELFVRADHRRQGIARALVLTLEQQARAAGATGWSVLTSEENKAAQAFYASLGFRPFAVALQKWFSDERPYRETNEPPQEQES